MWLNLGWKQFLFIFAYFYWCQYELFKQIQIFPGICPFSNLLRKTNFLSIFFSAPFWDRHFFDKKRKYSVNFPKNASKQQKSIV